MAESSNDIYLFLNFLKFRVSDKVMPKETEAHCKIPEKFDDNVVLFLCRGNDRRKVRFRKRDSVPKFKHEVMYVCFYLCFICYFILISNTTQLFGRLFLLLLFSLPKKIFTPWWLSLCRISQAPAKLEAPTQKT